MNKRMSNRYYFVLHVYLLTHLRRMDFPYEEPMSNFIGVGVVFYFSKL